MDKYKASGAWVCSIGFCSPLLHNLLKICAFIFPVIGIGHTDILQGIDQGNSSVFYFIKHTVQILWTVRIWKKYIPYHLPDLSVILIHKIRRLFQPLKCICRKSVCYCWCGKFLSCIGFIDQQTLKLRKQGANKQSRNSHNNPYDCHGNLCIKAEFFYQYL